jgi:ParB/RepB/Spo0J family partition protein
MNAITPFALAYASVLRKLAEPTETPLDLADLAKACGKIPSNLRRDLPKLRAQGLLADGEPLQLGIGGRAVLMALDGGGKAEANGVRAAGDAPEGFTSVPHQLIVPDTLNPREAFDDDALAELAASIKTDGLLQNLVVRPAAPMEGFGQPMHRLVAGERRWRAIRILIVAGDWPADRPIPCKVADLDDTGHAVIALLENLQRKDLNAMEEARAFKRLIDHHGFKTADIAGRINATQRLVQQRLQLLELDSADQDKVVAGKLSIEQARSLIANRPKPFNLDPAARLMLLEITHRVLASPDPSAFYNSLPIGDPAGDPTTTVLRKHDLIWTTADWNDGTLKIRLAYSARRALAEITGNDDPDFITLTAALDSARVGAGVAPPSAPGQYATTWLNPPWAIDPERKAEIEQRAARGAEAERKGAERKAKIVGFKAAARTLELSLQKRLATAADGALQAALEAMGVALPLTLKNDAIEDANGLRVAATSYHGSHQEDLRAPTLRLLALAINAGLGFPTSVGVQSLMAQEDDADDDADGDDSCDICGGDLDQSGDCAACLEEDSLSPAALRLAEPSTRAAD